MRDMQAAGKPIQSGCRQLFASCEPKANDLLKLQSWYMPWQSVCVHPSCLVHCALTVVAVVRALEYVPRGRCKFGNNTLDAIRT